MNYMSSKVIAISRFQGVVDFNKVKSDGVIGVFSRLGEGGSYIDPTFIENFAKCKKSQIEITGAWHIFRALSSTPFAQATTIVNKMKEAGVSKGDMLAFEVYKSSGSNKDATREQMANNLYTLINAVKEQLPQVELLIKTNIDTWKNHVAWELFEDEFSSINLWVEQWRTSPDYPETLYPWGKDGWKFWEYSSTGKVAGINGNVLVSKTIS